MRLKLFCYVFTVVLLGCSTAELPATVNPSPTATLSLEIVELVATAVPISTLSPTATMSPPAAPTPIPTATLIPPLTPIPLGPTPAGIVYQLGADIWLTMSEGPPRLLYSSPAITSASAQLHLSSEGDMLIVQDVPNETFLTDLATGRRTVFDASVQPDIPGYTRDLVWWPGQSDQILVLFSRDGDHYRSGLAIANRDGTNWRVLANGAELWNNFAIHPTEDLLAASLEGQPLLLNADGRSTPLDLAQYNLPIDRSYFSPSWSPDGRYLTWLFAETETWPPDESSMGLALIDREAGSAQTTHGFITFTADGPLPPPTWSPDGRFLAYVASYAGQTIIFQADGRELLRTEWTFGSWLSDSTQFLTTPASELNRQGVYLVSVADGLETAVQLPIPIEAAHLGANGQIFLIPTWDSRPQLFAIYDPATGRLSQVEWPAEAKFLAWLP